MLTPFFKNDAIHNNVATCLNGQETPTKQLYFCPKIYPPPESSSEQIPNNLTSWVHLKCDLEKYALASGLSWKSRMS